MPFKDFNTREDQAIADAVNKQLDFDLLSNALWRPEYVIAQRAFQLGLVGFKENCHLLLSHRRDGWRSDEVDHLISNPGASRKELASDLNRSAQSVAKQLFEFRLVHGGRDYDWNVNELQYLTCRIMHDDAKTISSALGRSPIDVKHKAISLGLTHRDVVLTSFSGHTQVRSPRQLNGGLRYAPLLQSM